MLALTRFCDFVGYYVGELFVCVLGFYNPTDVGRAYCKCRLNKRFLLLIVIVFLVGNTS